MTNQLLVARRLKTNIETRIIRAQQNTTVASIDHEVNTGALDELFEQLSECCERIKRLQQDALSASFSAAASPRAPASAGPSSAAAASSSIAAEESEEEDAGLDFSGLPSEGPASPSLIAMIDDAADEETDDEDNEWESGDEGSESVWEGEEHEAELEPEDTSDAEDSDDD